jgi:quercetin dioxygenase-like cupin family protein
LEAFMTPRSHAIRVPLLVLAALVLLAGSTVAATTGSRPGRGVTVTHGPVTLTLTTPGSDGHQLGDLRVGSVDAIDESGDAVRIDATLVTTGVDTPSAGDEVRVSTLVFTFDGDVGQVIASASGVYPAAGATIEEGSTIVRAIVGGTGRWVGRQGLVETTHEPDDTWTHVFRTMGRGILPLRPIRPSRPFRPTGPDAPSSARPSAGSGGIVRQLLGETQAPDAPGQTLSLWRYTIPAGAELAPHVHRGVQVARIVIGSFRYDVDEGEATVVRADGTVETLGSGDSAELRAGDTVVEHAGLAHGGVNAGRLPVVIVASSLVATGEDLTSPIPASSASPTP